MGLKQSVCYPAFKPSAVSMDEFCYEVACLGYAAVELWGWDESLDETVAIAMKHGLRVASLTGHESIDSGLNDESQHERIVSELKRSIDKAAEHGIPGVICFSGSRHPQKSDLEGLSTFIQGARKIVPYAEAKGVNLNVEILNSRVDHPGYQCDKVDWAIAACVGVNSPRMKLLFDIYHVQIMEGDIIRNLRKAAPYIGHIHTAGNPGRHDMDETQELNYTAIAKAICEMGYEGFVGHELFTSLPDWKSALSGAFEVCSV